MVYRERLFGVSKRNKWHSSAVGGVGGNTASTVLWTSHREDFDGFRCPEFVIKRRTISFAVPSVKRLQILDNDLIDPGLKQAASGSFRLTPSLLMPGRTGPRQ